MNLTPGLLRVCLFAGTSVFGAAAGCVGDEPLGGAAATIDASTSGGSSGVSSSSGAAESDAASLPDAPAPVIDYCAVQPSGPRKFCEDFENTGNGLGSWTTVPPPVPPAGRVSLTDEPGRGKVLFIEVDPTDAATPQLLFGKTFEQGIEPPYVLEYDLRVNEHAPAAKGAPLNGFISMALNGADVALFGVAEGQPILGGGGGGEIKRDAGRGPDLLNPYVPGDSTTIEDIGFNEWFHVRMDVSATSTTQVLFRNTRVTIVRRTSDRAQLASFTVGFQRGFADRWTVFYDNVIVRTLDD